MLQNNSGGSLNEMLHLQFQSVVSGCWLMQKIKMHFNSVVQVKRQHFVEDFFKY